MEPILTAILLALAIFFPNFKAAKAQQACVYRDTQARVQANIQDPWKPSVSIGCDRSFNVGSFHNGTGQFSDDTTLRVTGPNGYNQTFRNGDTVRVSDSGTYTLSVTTNNQSGNGCQEQATAVVSCTPPAPAPSCSWGSTQARVQTNINDPWKSSVTVGCDRSFNIGSFHNGTGQFAGDTTLWITGPGISQPFRNGDTVRTSFDGTYTLSVTTNGQSGPACSEQAQTTVSCFLPTPTPTPLPSPSIPLTCTYMSTQARVQKDSNDPWKSTMAVACGDAFNVGSFHNNTGQFAGDTFLFVADPSGNTWTQKNGERVVAGRPGTYVVVAATSGQGGASCVDAATVVASCK